MSLPTAGLQELVKCVQTCVISHPRAGSWDKSVVSMLAVAVSVCLDFMAWQLEMWVCN